MSWRTLLWLLPLLPLAGSVICGALHFAVLRARRSGRDGRDGASRQAALAQLAGRIACGTVGLAFVVGLAGLTRLIGDGAPTAIVSSRWEWIDAGSAQFDVALVLDRLSSVMVLVVTGVGLLIHVYSLGYMKGDPGFAKFFAYLNLFLFAMLVLVLSDNLLGLFVGWEGVGLCSYLLIGFWYAKGWPAEAGQKAFVMNRIGDACFLFGSFILVYLFHSLDLGHIVAGAAEKAAENPGQVALAALLLFAGACGKSAQWPLFTWLPDAMAGPTPVSALIHAATMVTAGVYLLVRLNPLYTASPGVMLVVATVGALTALIGASTALMQRDIKKVLAYSTISQLGFMFLGVGVGAFGAAIFHLVTHAFFKSLLFLGSGSVIHGMHDEQDMHKMGGLRRQMPRTFVTFLCGAAALSGLPLMSGFFSKDEVLAHAFGHGGFAYVLWFVGVAVAALTAFYTWRMVALTFFGEARYDAARVQPHESPSLMTVPLAVLAVLSVVGGLLGLPHVFHARHVIASWLEPVIGPSFSFTGEVGAEAATLGVGAEWALLGLGALIALVFAHRGFHAFTRGPAAHEEFERAQPQAAGFLSGAWHVDRAYANGIVRPLRLFSYVIAIVVDQLAIDGAVNGAGLLARRLGHRLRVLADGNVKSYAIWMGAGAAVLACLWIWSGGA
ncbi:MAG: NADH-quinone oxidoreductase subunit L [Planctomycetota bacterium]|nr:NADH-quinone oxidoreductase subunit L [Planctomycetota bacterium]